MRMKPKTKIPSDNPREIFDEAEDFLFASNIIKKASSEHLKLNGTGLISINRAIGLSFVNYVNHAYAFELYIKCLMVIESGYFYSGHKLFELFSYLSQETQEKITTQHNDSTMESGLFYTMKRISNADFVGLITKAHEPFLDYRYLFNGKQTKGYDLHRALETVREIIFQMKPEYRTGAVD